MNETLDLSKIANPSGTDIITLQRELEEIQTEQTSGKWDFAGTSPEEKVTHDLFVQARVKRAIEILATLRRSNTGPAKPKTLGPRAKKAAEKTAVAEKYADLAIFD